MVCPSPRGSALSCERMGLQASTSQFSESRRKWVQEHARNAIGDVGSLDEALKT